MPGPLPITSSWVKLNGKEIQLRRSCLTLRDPWESLSAAVNRSDGISGPPAPSLSSPQLGEPMVAARISAGAASEMGLLAQVFSGDTKTQQQKELPFPGERAASGLRTLTRSSPHRAGGLQGLLPRTSSGGAAAARSDTEEGTGLGERALHGHHYLFTGITASTAWAAEDQRTEETSVHAPDRDEVPSPHQPHREGATGRQDGRSQGLTPVPGDSQVGEVSAPSRCSASSSRPQHAFCAQHSRQQGKLKCLPDSWPQKLCFSLHLSSDSDTVRQANIEGDAAVPNTLQKMTVVSN